MEKTQKHDLAQLTEDFIQLYSYIAIDRETVEETLKNYINRDASEETILDLARDYILSQDLADEVVL